MNQEEFIGNWSGDDDKTGYIYPEAYPPPDGIGFTAEAELNEDPAGTLFPRGQCSICGRLTGISSYKGGNICDHCLSFIGRNC